VKKKRYQNKNPRTKPNLKLYDRGLCGYD